MNDRIDLVVHAVKKLKEDTAPSLKMFGQMVASALSVEPKTIYVATFWDKESMSGYNWNINHMPVRTVFEDWKKDLIADGNAGVVGLFKVKLPVYINMTDSESINEYLDLMDDNGQFPRQGVVLDQYRQHMTEEEGF